MSALPDDFLTVEALAAQPRWPAAQVRQLKGQCIGSVMKDWATHVRRRWGEHAEAQVRAQLGACSADLPSAPTEAIWLPVYYQVLTSDIVIEQFLAGDALALEELLWEDGQRSSHPALTRILRWLGPGAFLRQAGTIHKQLYDFGEILAQVGWNHAHLTLQGGGLFANPTWQLTQLFAIRLFLRAIERTPLELYGRCTSPETFEIKVKWR